MTIEQTMEPKGDKNFRIFIICLAASETLRISDDTFITPRAEGIRFFLFGRHGTTSGEPAFRPMPDDDNEYHMYTKGGFKTNEEQLDYLINLKDVPILIPGANDNEIPIGYVRFKKAS